MRSNRKQLIRVAMTMLIASATLLAVLAGLGTDGLVPTVRAADLPHEIGMGDILVATGDNGSPVDAVFPVKLTATSAVTTWHYVPLVLKNYKPFVNGSFENGWSGWAVVAGSQLPVSLPSNVSQDSTRIIDGARTLLLGNPGAACEGGIPVGGAGIRQTFAVPGNATYLLFNYVIFTHDAFKNESYDHFAVNINGTKVFSDGNQLNSGLGCGNLRRVPGPDNPRESTDDGDSETLEWAIGRIPLEDYRDESITLVFSNYNLFDGWYNTFTYIDDIRIVTE